MSNASHQRIYECFLNQQNTIPLLLPEFIKSYAEMYAINRSHIFYTLLEKRYQIKTRNIRSFYLNPKYYFNENIWKDIQEHILQKNGLISSFSKSEKSQLNQAFIFFKEINPSLHSLFFKVFKHSILLRNSTIKTSSSPHLLGLFILGESFFSLDPYRQVEYFVHELAHQELFLLNTLDKLATKETQYSLKYSPFAKKYRPPLGRMHAFFALYRSLEFLLLEKLPFPNEYLEYFQDTYKSFTYDELTPYAQKLLELWALKINKMLQEKFKPEVYL